MYIFSVSVNTFVSLYVVGLFGGRVINGRERCRGNTVRDTNDIRYSREKERKDWLLAFDHGRVVT